MTTACVCMFFSNVFIVKEKGAESNVSSAAQRLGSTSIEKKERSDNPTVLLPYYELSFENVKFSCFVEQMYFVHVKRKLNACAIT